MLKKQIINQKYDPYIRFFIGCILGTVVAGAAFNYRTGVVDLNFKHFDAEMGIGCVFNRTYGAATFDCKQYGTAPLRFINPEDKMWQYETEHGSVHVTRRSTRDNLVIILDHPKIIGGASYSFDKQKYVHQ
ncbi:hypothetical protein [Vibrio crassostreae]|uniref:hypothetical protein n=1 Tax=Vibrio crassostreae TaxID=246167 RepID=UPI001B30E167|nr:hypothetical protein [Vibrio crassostreae]